MPANSDQTTYPPGNSVQSYLFPGESGLIVDAEYLNTDPNNPKVLVWVSALFSGHSNTIFYLSENASEILQANAPLSETVPADYLPLVNANTTDQST
jgi:hypothetical protein